MSTIKLNKSPSNSSPTGKSPVRRTPNHMRDRTKAPAPAVIANIEPVPAERDSKQRSESSRQRNHRYDGRLREDDAETRTRNQNSDRRTSPPPNRDEPHYRQAPRRGGKLRDGYDAQAKPRPASPVNPPSSTRQSAELPRLSKRMSELGLCSRREADEWISNGWVKVNGKVVNELGVRVDPQADIQVDREAKLHQSEQVTILLHKPVGYVSGQAEDGYHPAVVLLHPDNQWPEDPLISKRFKRGFLTGIAPAGRLDIDSTGLLVFTQDGRIARQLIGDDSTIEKEYLVRVEGQLSELGLKKLNHGLQLDGVMLKPARVSWQNEDQLRFVLREGRKRQIRRMCELVGLRVVGLKRVRIGSVSLGKLPPGQWRYLRPNERF